MSAHHQWRHGYDAILAEVTRQTGITFAPFNSGGGCMILEGRLESGLWIWITDVDPGLTCLHTRRAYEAAGVHLGWMITIHPTDPEEPGGATPDGGTTVASVTHHSAPATQPPALIILALQAAARHAHHDIDADGRHTIRHGITRW